MTTEKITFNTGDYVSVLNYYKITDKFDNKFILSPKVGEAFEVDREILEDEGKSASWVTETKKVTMTELADIFVNVTKSDVFTVCFTTKDNSERVLIGHRIETIPNLGYSLVKDLEINEAKDSGLREVNHRTILWLIHNGLKYELKNKKSKK